MISIANEILTSRGISHTMILERDTLYLEAYEGYFMEDSVNKKARVFVIGYFKNAYENEVRKFAEEQLHAELYGFPFRWEDYDVFKVKIDEAYQKWTEVVESQQIGKQ